MTRRKKLPRAGAAPGVIRRAARSPAWTQAGVFTYPPRILWKTLRSGAISRKWKAFPRSPSPRDPVGLYVHIPAEVQALGRFFSSGKTHPYIECLKREADYLRLPEGLPIRTLYIGGAGSGALSRLSAPEIDRLLAWLRRRFRLRSLKQASVDADAAQLSEDKVRVLVRRRVNRVAARLPADNGTLTALQNRREFAKGIRLCRKKGVRTISIDLAAGRSGRSELSSAREDLDFVRKLKPDNFCLCDYGPLRGGGGAKPTPQERNRPEENNLQLVDSGRDNASILGLGWGAISHIRGSLVYGAVGSCFEYSDALIRGRSPRYAGSSLNQRAEMRAHIIRALEDTGRVERSAFRAIFAQEPEDAFGPEFSRLMDARRLLTRDDTLCVAASKVDYRYACSLHFYGRDILRRLSRKTLEQAGR